MTQITTQEIREYLAWLRKDYTPVRFDQQTHPLSPKTIRNIWVTLAAFFKWISQEFDIPNPMQGIPAPKFQKTPNGGVYQRRGRESDQGMQSHQRS